MQYRTVELAKLRSLVKIVDAGNRSRWRIPIDTPELLSIEGRWIVLLPVVVESAEEDDVTGE